MLRELRLVIVTPRSMKALEAGIKAQLVETGVGQ
jgi:hypothetical protein